jgi:hypothetical protein
MNTIQQITTIGADPELFLIGADGKFMSSVGLIGGTKDMPRPIDEEGNAVQEDNVTVEFNIPPCKTSADFIKHINKNKEWIRKRAAQLGFQLAIRPSAVFDDDQLETMEAQTFGCEPDFNAWNNGEQNPRPSAENKNLRSCGGHIHIALTDDDPVLMVIKAMDLFVGCMMLEFDDDKGRRELYGKAGAFRKKAYGVEYRTASNRWVESDERIQWAWDQTEKALSFVRNGGTFTEEDGQMIQDCINNSDMTLLGILKEKFQL